MVGTSAGAADLLTLARVAGCGSVIGSTLTRATDPRPRRCNGFTDPGDQHQGGWVIDAG